MLNKLWNLSLYVLIKDTLGCIPWRNHLKIMNGWRLLKWFCDRPFSLAHAVWYLKLQFGRNWTGQECDQFKLWIIRMFLSQLYYLVINKSLVSQYQGSRRHRSAPYVVARKVAWMQIKFLRIVHANDIEKPSGQEFDQSLA